MDSNVSAVIERHFAFESPELVDRITETFTDDITWEAPSRGILLTSHDEIVTQYKKIIKGIIDPEIEPLRQFNRGDEVFDDRILRFITADQNVWSIEPGKRVKMRLAHYFKIRGDKICQEIGYEMIHIL